MARMRMLAALLSLAVVLVVSPGSVRAADALAVETFTLENGLRVVVVPLHRAPVVSHNLIILAGAADDPLGSSGVAHYLEHMLFKGTPDQPDGEYTRRIEALGGQYNAYTSADMTGYYVTAAREHLGVVMELEAERMMHLAPSAEAFVKERDVILEERKLRTDASPAALLSEAMDAALFVHHPYGTPIIGWEHEMAALDEVKAMAFFRQHYTPRNAVLLVVGDVTRGEVEKLARAHYGTWEGAPKASRRWVSEPPRRTAARVSMPHPTVRSPRLYIRYAAPSLGTASNANQVMPLLFAEELLGNPRSGALYEALVKQSGLAAQVAVSYQPMARGESTLDVVLVPAEGADLDALEAAYEAALKAFAATPIPERALERTRNQLKASSIFARDSMQGMAFILAQLIAIDKDPGWFNQWESLVEGVTEAQIRQSVADHMQARVAVTGVLLPEVTEEEGQ